MGRTLQLAVQAPRLHPAGRRLPSAGFPGLSWSAGRTGEPYTPTRRERGACRRRSLLPPVIVGSRRRGASSPEILSVPGGTPPAPSPRRAGDLACQSLWPSNTAQFSWAQKRSSFQSEF